MASRLRTCMGHQYFILAWRQYMRISRVSQAIISPGIFAAAIKLLGITRDEILARSAEANARHLSGEGNGEGAPPVMSNRGWRWQCAASWCHGRQEKLRKILKNSIGLD